MKKNENLAIKVENVTKSFKLYYDKPSTLKERLVFWNKKKSEDRVVLKNINLDIKKEKPLLWSELMEVVNQPC